MSNYRVSSPLAVRSPASSGQINLFSAGTSNSVQVSTPNVLSSNLTMTLPSTTPNISGEFLSTNGAGVLSWSNATGGTRLQGPINRRSFSNSTTPISTTSTTPVIADYCELRRGNGLPNGPTNASELPFDCYAIISASDNTTTVRIQVQYDVLRLDTTSGVLTANTPTIFFVGNIPSSNIGGTQCPQILLARGAGAGTVTLWGYQFIPTEF